MAERDERLYLVEILGAIDRALEYTTGGRDAFFAEAKTQDAVIRNVEVIDPVSAPPQLAGAGTRRDPVPAS